MKDLCVLSGMPKDLCGLYSALVDADDQGDTQALARLGWVLFTKAGTAQEAHHEAVGLLAELRAAACAVVADEGSPASLGLLRAVLAKRGWLPPPGATPLGARHATKRVAIRRTARANDHPDLRHQMNHR